MNLPLCQFLSYILPVHLIQYKDVGLYMLCSNNEIKINFITLYLILFRPTVIQGMAFILATKDRIPLLTV